MARNAKFFFFFLSSMIFSGCAEINPNINLLKALPIGSTSKISLDQSMNSQVTSLDGKYSAEITVHGGVHEKALTSLDGNLVLKDFKVSR